MKKQKVTTQKPKLTYRVNEQIRVPQVRIIFPAGTQEVMNTIDAKRVAEERNQDLIEEFLRKGNRVRATIVFLGRSIIYKDKGLDLAERLTERLSVVSTRDGDPKFEGKKLFVYFEPDKKKIDAYDRIRAKTNQPPAAPLAPLAPEDLIEEEQ